MQELYPPRMLRVPVRHRALISSRANVSAFDCAVFSQVGQAGCSTTAFSDPGSPSAFLKISAARSQYASLLGLLSSELAGSRSGACTVLS